MHLEGGEPWRKREQLTRKRRASIKLFYITLRPTRARASPRSHNINACYISRPRRHSARLRIFRYVRGKISQISGKAFRARKHSNVYSRARIYTARAISKFLLSSFSFFFHTHKSISSPIQVTRAQRYTS